MSTGRGESNFVGPEESGGEFCGREGLDLVSGGRWEDEERADYYLRVLSSRLVSILASFRLSATITMIKTQV